MTRILLVDDSKTIRRALSAAIGRESESPIEIVEAADAGEAIAAFCRTKPDAVFLDMMLSPGESGLEAQRAIMNESPDARIVVVTALSPDDPKVVAAASIGALAYLQKPVHATAIRHVLRTLVNAAAGRFS